MRLKCTASGNPRPDIVWLKDSRPLADEDSGAGGDGQKKKKWTLSLKNLTPEHSGKYTCHVSNRAGEINATYKLEVIREYFDSIIGEKGFKKREKFILFKSLYVLRFMMLNFVLILV